MENYNCPVCKSSLPFNARYPNYVCKDCAAKATDANGRKLSFYNTSLGGGYMAIYPDTNESYEGHICYVDGVKCRADEARFGGIVIEKIIDNLPVSNFPMLPIELRQNKASMTPLLWLLGLVATGIFAYLIYSRKGGINPIKIILFFGACLMGYAVWYTVKKINKNEPLLTFLREGLEINENRPEMISWQEITNWDVTRSDATDYLIINTKQKTYRINISWLETKPAEVENLVKSFLHTAH